MSLRNRMLIPIIGLLIIAACVSVEQPLGKTQYYTLEYDPPLQGGMVTIPATIRLDLFRVAPQYNTTQIVYRDAPYKRQSYYYHKWRSHPADLVTHYLARDIRESRLFQAVVLHDSRIPSDYMLDGSVDEICENDNNGTWEAVLTVSIVLMAEKEPDISKKILLQKTYSETEPCRQRNPEAVVEAMSRAMARLSLQIIGDIYALRKPDGGLGK